MVAYNPACYLPSNLNSYLPNAISCPPPPTLAKTFFQMVTSPVTNTYSTLKHTIDTFVGLPFLSFLLIPTFSSYSTSLNLLFFYLTWSTLVLSHHPLRVEIVGSFVIKVLCYVLPSSIMLAFDVCLPGVSGGWKTLGVDALPFTVDDMRKKNLVRFASVIFWSLVNVILGVSLQGLVEYVFMTQLGWQTAVRVTTTLPLPWGIVKDLLKGMFARDALTWLVRRYLLHAGPRPANAIVRDLSNLHGKWYHRVVKAPFPLSPSYDHPLVFVLRSWLPMYAPTMYFRFHALTFMLYLVLVSLEDTLTHSGYARLPTNFVLGGVARRHELYCLTKGDGNFGTWGICDWIFGTSIGQDIADDIMEEMDEADMQGRLAEQAGRGIAKARRAASGSGRKSPTPSKPRRRTRRTRSASDSE